MIAVKLKSDDGRDQIADFYRNELARFGTVLDCTVPEPAERSKRETKSRTLTCDGERAKRNGFLFKAGAKANQRIVSIEPRAMPRTSRWSTSRYADSTELNRGPAELPRGPPASHAAWRASPRDSGFCPATVVNLGHPAQNSHSSMATTSHRAAPQSTHAALVTEFHREPPFSNSFVHLSHFGRLGKSPETDGSKDSPAKVPRAPRLWRWPARSRCRPKMCTPYATLLRPPAPPLPAL